MLASTPDSLMAEFQLASAEVILVNGDDKGLSLLMQVFSGFGVRRIHPCATAAEAMQLVAKIELSLIVCEAALPMTDGFEFVRWLRWSEHEPNRFRPVILMTGQAKQADILRARDCGANIVVTRPIVPDTILQRILWLAREPRPFITSETYCGPDRRYHNLGPPPGTAGRRKDDLSAHVGVAQGPNLSQDDIDNLFQAKAAS